MTYRGAVLDVDGTVLRGDDLVPGAAEGLAALDDRGVRRLFVSNNPTKRPGAYVDRLGGAGVDAEESSILTSGTVTVEHLRAERPDDALLVVGEEGLRAQLRDAGFDLVERPDAADCVVVSVDRSFSYDRLKLAGWALADDGVGFVGTDPDRTIPTGDRPVPGSGAIVNAVAGVAGRDPDAVLGKPSEPARRMALDRLGAAAEDCLVVGDRLDTDVAFGERAGMTTVLVRTGIADDEAVAESDVAPDYVLDSLADVPRVLDDR